jgi:hypothetical protein
MSHALIKLFVGHRFFLLLPNNRKKGKEPKSESDVTLVESQVKYKNLNRRVSTFLLSQPK